MIRDGGLFPGDALDYLPDDEAATSYVGRRWQLARAEVQQVVREAELAYDGFFAGKVVLDVGPGPLGFPDACPAGDSAPPPSGWDVDPQLRCRSHADGHGAPHTLIVERVKNGLVEMTIEYERRMDGAHSHDGHIVVLGARADGSPFAERASGMSTA